MKANEKEIQEAINNAIVLSDSSTRKMREWIEKAIELAREAGVADASATNLQLQKEAHKRGVEEGKQEAEQRVVREILNIIQSNAYSCCDGDDMDYNHDDTCPTVLIKKKYGVK